MLVKRAVAERGFAVAGPFSEGRAALGAVAEGGVSAALLDVSLGNGATSAPVAKALSEAGVPFAFVTGYGPSTASVVSPFPDRLVIPKPLDAETLALLLAQLVTPQPGARLAG